MQGKVSPEQGASAEAPVYVGIDVCKEWLDVYLHPLGGALRVANTSDGLKVLKRRLRRTAVALVVMEATGKLHRLAQRGLHAASVTPVAHAGEHHRHAVFVRGGDDLVITHGSTRLNDRHDAGRGRLIDAVTEREKGIRGHHRTAHLQTFVGCL